MHWLATKHLGVAVAMVFSIMSMVLGFASMRVRKSGGELPGWVKPIAITVLVAGCAVMCVAQI